MAKRRGRITTLGPADPTNVGATYPKEMWVAFMIGAVALAVLPLPYYVFQVGRWMICAGFAYLLYEYVQHGARSRILISLFGLGAILFNPIVPIHLGRFGYRLADLFAATIFFFASEMALKLAHLVALRKDSSHLDTKTSADESHRPEDVRVRLTVERAYNLALETDDPMSEMRALLRLAFKAAELNGYTKANFQEVRNLRLVCSLADTHGDPRSFMGDIRELFPLPI